ncbi:MAG: MobH family relaxase [Rhodocyclaceae bacterium]|nr:MobH family relaxase [Rhodocyclaceae bacterium]
MKGLPVVPPNKLLDTQQDLIARIANAAMDGAAALRRRYLPALQRFASFAHLLPASQSHHHRGAGGLLRHSLEVALWALQSADKVLLDAAKTPARRREIEPRWQLAVFLAALCHDAGKPVTDITVTNSERTAVWRPIKEDLYTWATSNGVDAYFLDWREGRSRQHTALSTVIGDRIIGLETLEWIEEGDTELIVWLMESLNCNPGPTNRIYDLVIKADQASVERDLRTLGVAMAGYDLGVPVERHLTDIMRRFVKETIWRVNEPGARLWNIGGNLYLVWPAAGEEIARQVAEDGIPGIPRTPDGILDMLVERQIALVRDGAAPGDRYWRIAPDILAEKIPDIQLPAIRLRDEAMVSSIPILPVAGRIVNEPGGGTQPAGPAVSDPSPASPIVTASRQAPHGEARSDGEEGGRKPVQTGGKRPSRNLDPQAEAPPAPAKREPCAVPEPVARGETPAIEFDGPVGEALKALAQDLSKGEKRWGRDALLDPENQVRLRWPDALAGYGLTPKAILDDLSGRGWLWIDPMAPLKKVLDAEIGGVTVKTIRLELAISQALVREAGGVAQVEDVGCGGMAESSRGVTTEPPDGREPGPESTTAPSLPPVENTKPSGKAQKAKASKAKSGSGDVPVGGQPNADGSAEMSDAESQTSAVGPAQSPSLEEVLAAIQNMPCQLGADGYRTAPKGSVIAACAQRGIKLSHSRVAVLARIAPEKFALENGVVRFKV